MKPDLVAAKLESLSRCVARLREKTPPDLHTLQQDADVQDILSVNLERAVQLCVDVALHWIATDSSSTIPETMADAFRVMSDQGALSAHVAERLVSAVGFRNLSVHAYDKINWEIVWNILTRELTVFPEFASEILKLTRR